MRERDASSKSELPQRLEENMRAAEAALAEVDDVRIEPGRKALMGLNRGQRKPDNPGRRYRSQSGQ